MMTQTHALIATVLLAKPERPLHHNISILLGSFAPDAAIFCLFFFSQFKGWSAQQLWSEVYFSEPMLTLTAISNSLPLYFCALLCCVFVYRLKDTSLTLASLSLKESESYKTVFTNSALGLFALAAITHLLGDFPVHASDAHPHFWPFSEWRFQSPISYWDNRHHGHLFSLFEATMGLIMSVFIFRRFNSSAVRILIALTIGAYILVPVYFSLVL